MEPDDWIFEKRKPQLFDSNSKNALDKERNSGKRTKSKNQTKQTNKKTENQ
jgi:hypothetical protein